mgnify:CR=1 FL=1
MNNLTALITAILRPGGMLTLAVLLVAVVLVTAGLLDQFGGKTDVNTQPQQAEASPNQEASTESGEPWTFLGFEGYSPEFWVFVVTGVLALGASVALFVWGTREQIRRGGDLSLRFAQVGWFLAFATPILLIWFREQVFRFLGLVFWDADRQLTEGVDRLEERLQHSANTNGDAAEPMFYTEPWFWVVAFITLLVSYVVFGGVFTRTATTPSGAGTGGGGQATGGLTWKHVLLVSLTLAFLYLVLVPGGVLRSLNVDSSVAENTIATSITRVTGADRKTRVRELRNDPDRSYSDPVLARTDWRYVVEHGPGDQSVCPEFVNVTTGERVDVNDQDGPVLFWRHTKDHKTPVRIRAAARDLLAGGAYKIRFQRVRPANTWCGPGTETVD